MFRTVRTYFGIFLLLAALAHEGHGADRAPDALALQEPAPKSSAGQSETQARIKVTSNLVILPVTVKDAAGELVGGLQQSDFRVYDDGIEQSIRFFTAESSPLSLVVLMDDDLPAGVAGQMVASLRAIAGGFGPEDEATVCRFDVLFYPGSGFVRDLDALWNQIEEAKSHGGPSTSSPIPPINTGPIINGESTEGAPTNAGHAPTKALDDAVHASAELLRERGADRRKIVLLISDGENGKRFNHHTYEDTLGELQRSNSSVFSLAVGSSAYRKRFSRLVRYANDSGGDIYYAANSRSMEKLYSRITEEARHEYTLAYMPTANGKQPEYHTVEVRLLRPGLTVKTRPGYRAIPPTAPGDAS